MEEVVVGSFITGVVLAAVVRDWAHKWRVQRARRRAELERDGLRPIGGWR